MFIFLFSAVLYSTGSISLALVHGLEWCHFHLKTCTFNQPFYLITPIRPLPFFPRSRRFFNQSPSERAQISKKNVRNKYVLLEYLDPLRLPFLSLSFKLPVVPGHAGHAYNDLANSLAKTGATLSFVDVPNPLAPAIAKMRNPSYAIWK